MGDHLGLTTQEVNTRVSEGRVNITSRSQTKPVHKIVFDNIFTLFNAINLGLFVLVLAAGSPQNGLFMLIILANIFIGIVQEIRAKKVIDSLKVLTEPHVSVIRDAKECVVAAHELVEDDVFIVKPGMQIVVDAQVISSENLETDESLLTGESDYISKHEGDKLFSGSYAMSGRAVARATHVGENCYAGKLTAEAKNFKPAKSEITTTLKKIIKLVSYVIIPVGILLFVSDLLRSGETWQSLAVTTTAALIGMIPEGLVLLTSVSFAAGVVKLALKRTVVQEMPGIELLARTDVLCLDKTGTITKGELTVNEVKYYTDDREFADRCICAVANAYPDKNATALALCAHFTDNPMWEMTGGVPFSSVRKWSGAEFSDKSIVIGAPEFLLEEGHEIRELSGEYAKNGLRVVLVARVDGFSEHDYTGKVTPLALITIFDVLRDNAAQTLEYFKKQGVTLKVISGDNPVTVANVASRVGLEGAENHIDVSKLTDDELIECCEKYSVFGRVSPKQKKVLVRALREGGHIVAMTGDGTNDVSALHESDCGIAMASGSDAAKGVAQIVLLDSDFTTLPSVVSEGRRVINNIERVASLFLVKTMFSMMLCVAFILLGTQYPFEPLQLTLISSCCVGIPSFFLALEPNDTRAVPGFLRKVLLRAFPSALAVVIGVLTVEALEFARVITHESSATFSVIILFTASFVTLVLACIPMNILRVILMAFAVAIFTVAIVFFGQIFDLNPISFDGMALLGGLCAMTVAIIFIMRHIVSKYYKKHPQSRLKFIDSHQNRD